MKNIPLISILILLLGIMALNFFVTPIKKENTPTEIDYRLVKYYNQFRNDAFSRGLNPNPKNKNITLKIVPELKSIVNNANLRGSTYFYNEREISIQINKQSYDTMNKNHKIALLYHELGHGLLDLDHTIDSGIMDPNLYKYDSIQIPEKKEILIDNLFNLLK